MEEVREPDDEVGRLDVAVHEAFAVERLDAVKHLAHDVARRRHREPLAGLSKANLRDVFAEQGHHERRVVPEAAREEGEVAGHEGVLLQLQEHV